MYVVVWKGKAWPHIFKYLLHYNLSAKSYGIGIKVLFNDWLELFAIHELAL